MVETSISWVLLGGEFAVKVPKPIVTDVVDQGTVEARAQVCADEVNLNRRLAPDVYLGVADLVMDGDVIDHAVVMRRMPDEGRLSSRLANLDADQCLRAVMKAMTVSHEQVGPAQLATARRIASGDGLARRWNADVDALGAIMAGTSGAAAGSRLDHIRSAALRYIEGRDRLFEDRIAGGHVRDGHGDLLADDIFCLSDGPRILDCLAFDQDLRTGDVVADVAFLAMDLDHRGHTGLADRALSLYTELSGDAYPATLADLYIAQRALVRAKVAAAQISQGDDQTSELTALLDLVEHRLDRATVRLVVIGGAPGTGKSTLAAALAERRGWVVIRSDEVRRDLGLRAADDGGGYRPESTSAVYGEAFDRVRLLLTA